MKLGNLTIKWHQHCWNWKIINEGNLNLDGGYFYKLGKKCIDIDCDYGGYKEVIDIHFDTKPNNIRVY